MQSCTKLVRWTLGWLKPSFVKRLDLGWVDERGLAPAPGSRGDAGWTRVLKDRVGVQGQPLTSCDADAPHAETRGLAKSA